MSGTNPNQTDLNTMGKRHHLSTASDCVALLGDVLACLDQLTLTGSGEASDRLTLAAAHVQQAVELVETAEDPNP